ncbi:MAG: zinc ribbon domain-containing protein [Nanoarchaeota archaeon]
MSCPRCQAVTGSNDTFCAQCGSPVQSGGQHSELIDESPENDVVSTCDKCGGGITEDQHYCPTCGAPVFTDESE